MRKAAAFTSAIKGYKAIHAIDSKLLPLGIGHAFLNALPLFVNLYLSSYIVGALLDRLSMRYILFIAALTVAINFIFSVLGSFVEKRLKTHRDIFHYKIHLYLNEHYTRLDFKLTEDNQTAEQLQSIIGIIRGYRGGLQRLEQMSCSLIETFFSLAGCLLLLGTIPKGTVNIGGHWILSAQASFCMLAMTVVLLLCTIAVTIISEKTSPGKSAFWSQNRSKISYFEKYMEGSQAAKEIRLYGQQKMIKELFLRYNNHYEHLIRVRRHGNGLDLLTALIGGIANAGLCLFISARAYLGFYSNIGVVIRLIGAIAALIRSMMRCVTLWSALMNNRGYLKPLYAYLDLPEVSDKMVGEKLDDQPDYTIEFKKVSFTYPGSKQPVLQNIDLTFQSGKRYTMVGVNGSGKSTIIKLLCRLYHPTEGEILLNGKNIDRYSEPDYRQLIAVVFQDFKLLPVTIGQSVASSYFFDGDKAAQCLDKAAFDINSDSFAQGLKTYLYKDFDPDGVNVSGGEAQRIALSRAIYRQSPIIVLDEPTAALDPQAEHEVFVSFNRVCENKLAVYISHRMSACRFCDQIVVIHDGRVIQQGSHSELLMDESGKYSELWSAQAKYYVETD